MLFPAGKAFPVCRGNEQRTLLHACRRVVWRKDSEICLLYTSITVTATGVEWEYAVPSSADWITVDDGTAGKLLVSVAKNPTAEKRTASITIKPLDNKDIKTKSVTVTQAGSETPEVYSLEVYKRQVRDLAAVALVSAVIYLAAALLTRGEAGFYGCLLAAAGLSLIAVGIYAWRAKLKNVLICLSLIHILSAAYFNDRTAITAFRAPVKEKD